MTLSWVAMVGFTGLGVLVLAWLIASFAAPSPRRVFVEWLGTCGMYVALLSLFVHLSLRAQEEGSTAALVAFGLLVALFASGLAVALVQTLLSMRSPSAAASSATN